MNDEERKKNRISMMLPKKDKSIAVLSNKSSGRLTGMVSMSRMKMRRMSYGFGGVAGIMDVDRSQVPLEFKRPPLVYLSTYQLDPRPDRVFNVPRVTRMAHNLLDKLWIGHKYDASESPALAILISSKMMIKAKYMNFNRYRVISVVTIGEKRAQSYNNAITFLWDHERDKYIDVQRECTTNFIHVTIFGIYLD